MKIWTLTAALTVEGGSTEVAAGAFVTALAEGRCPITVGERPRQHIARHQPGRRAPPLSWYPMGTGACLVCRCGNSVALDPAIWTIRPDGEVSPSFDCRGCGFHDFVALDGWGAP